MTPAASEAPRASPTTTSFPLWIWITACFGLAWNLFGGVQFLGAVNGTVDSFMKGGMTRDQAELYFNLPLWMNAAFALGVFGGLAGSMLLLARRKAAVPVFAISLVAYLVLYAGDITQGVFAAFGKPQIVILTTVVLIAAGLLWLARHLRQRGLLK